MHSLLLFALARAPDRPLVSEGAFDFPVPDNAVRANERQAPASRFIVLQSLPVEFHVASVSTFGAPVPLHIARSEAKREARQAYSATAVLCRVFQHVLVEVNGGLVPIACLTTPSLGFAGAVDALPGVPVKGPGVLLSSASFARMTIGAAWNEILCCVRSVMDVAHWKLPALQKFVADRTSHLPAALDP